ncbi:MAG: hypothetical protein JOZ40_20535 [Methylobacteriaceae bacterium]|nr:hypothetical protein [Methylobacteriaceae bacterium]
MQPRGLQMLSAIGKDSAHIRSAALALAMSSLWAAPGTAGGRTLPLGSVATYKPMQGFNHVVDDTRFVGYFLTKDDACSVTVMIAVADDEELKTPPHRVQIEIPAANRSEIAVGNGDALGIACTVDADLLKIVPLKASRTATR